MTVTVRQRMDTLVTWCAGTPRKAAIRIIVLENALAELILDIENKSGDPDTLGHAKQDLEKTYVP
jgi:hypothetical protein